VPAGFGGAGGNGFSDRPEGAGEGPRVSRITPNSLDAVSDRDFALEYLFALSALAMHLSRLSEDMILFASPEFGFLDLPDEYSTGQQPDAAEEESGCVGTDPRQNGTDLRRAFLRCSRRRRDCPRATSAICRRTRKRFSRRTTRRWQW